MIARHYKRRTTCSANIFQIFPCLPKLILFRTLRQIAAYNDKIWFLRIEPSHCCCHDYGIVRTKMSVGKMRYAAHNP